MTTIFEVYFSSPNPLHQFNPLGIPAFSE